MKIPIFVVDFKKPILKLKCKSGEQKVKRTREETSEEGNQRGGPAALAFETRRPTELQILQKLKPCAFSP